MSTTLRATTTALLCLSAWLLPQTSQAQALPKPVQQALKDAQIPPAAMGTWVQEVNLKATPPRPGKISVNAQAPMAPASVMKLVTSSAALDVFGPAQRWKTHAYITTPIIAGVLRGDLILQGGGDPKLVYENFWQLLRQLRNQGLREIEGNIIIDRSLFAIAETTGAEFDGEPSRAYNVGPDALLLNFKALRLRLIPDAGQVKLQSEPPLAGVEIVPPLLGNGPCGEWKDNLTLTWQGKNLLIQGSYPASCGIQNWAIHPHGLNANQYAQALFSALWAELGGSFSGQVKDGKLADLVAVSSPQLIAEWDSPSLAELLRDTNKYSNNVMARHLLLLLGTRQAGATGDVRTANSTNTTNSTNSTTADNSGSTAQRGVHAIQQWLAQHDLPATSLVLENGAGLSDLERISARELGKILIHGWRSAWMPELLASLPVVGLDGTMRNRLKQGSASGQAHIKTGTLHNVRSIAGYVRGQSGKMYVVVSMINHERASQGQKVHDALIQWLVDKG